MMQVSNKRPKSKSVLCILLFVLMSSACCQSSPARENSNSDVRAIRLSLSNNKRSGKAIDNGSGRRIKDSTSLLQLQDLSQYNLAVCADGSQASYYAEQPKVDKDAMKKVMIYLGDENSRQNECSSVEECLFICNLEPDRCKSPESSVLRKNGGIWSREDKNNPFSKYFKIYIPECSLDQFSGTRGPLTNEGSNSRAIGQKPIYFHGKHIFNSVLRHLVSNFRINTAEEIILVGSGNSASGVARNCDFLADAISTVNSRTRVRCVLDGPTDFNPFWIQDIMTNKSSTCGKTVKQVAEDTKFLWGRRDDESCLQNLKDDLNSTSLAEYCGIFSRSWQHVSTPMFVITSQWNGKKFDEITCNLDPEKDPNYGAYVTAWRQGMIGVVQAMSEEKPENGWFIPNCGTDGASFFLSSDKMLEEELVRQKRKNVRIPLFAKPETKKNVLQVLNSWVNSIEDVDDHQAIDILGFPNPACSSDDDSDDGSNKLRSSLNLDLRPELLLSSEGGNSLISTSSFGGSDFLPLPSPRDLFAVDPVFSSQAPTNFGIDDADAPIFVDGSSHSHPVPRIRTHTRGKSTTHHLGTTTKTNYPGYMYYPGYYNLDFGSPSPKVTTTSDLDLDFLYGQDSYNENYYPTVLPESTIKVSNYGNSRKARLWRKVYYLEYLRELYRRSYREYYRDYYYGN